MRSPQQREASRVRPLRRALLALLLALFARGARAEGAIHEAIAYAGAADGAPTLDLFLPAPGKTRPPLLAFVESRFWQDDEQGSLLAQGLARPLQRAGAAVALIRHRPAPAAQHPRQAEDVARALAFLVAHAGEYGYDPARIALSGRGSGAQLAALVALDRHFLEAHDLSPDTLLGVATHSGVYDLAPEDGFASDEEEGFVLEAFPDAAARRAASPLRQLRKDAPLFLITFAAADLPGAEAAGNAFAQALRKAGAPAAEAFGIPGRDFRSQLDLRDAKNPMLPHLLALLGLGPEYTSLRETFAMRRFWRDPTPYRSAGFWDDEKHVVTQDANPLFLRDLNLLFTGSGGRPRLRPQRFHALELFAWLERHAKQVGSGRYLVLTNARGEQAVFELEALRPYQPYIAIGADEERELFRLVDFYHTERRSTAQAEPERWILARPVGAFLHFAKEAPPELDPRAIGRFELTPESFARVDEDPLAPLRALAPEERRLLTEEFRCVACHSFRGAGGRAAHLRARDGEHVGGYGLPLEEYPPQVWRRYCFEQNQVAAEIGATPVPLEGHARALFELVERERAAQGR